MLYSCFRTSAIEGRGYSAHIRKQLAFELAAVSELRVCMCAACSCISFLYSNQLGQFSVTSVRRYKLIDIISVCVDIILSH